MFAPVIVSAAPPTRTEHDCHALVQVVDRAGQIRRHCAFVIRMRNDHKNVDLVAFIRPFNLQRLLRTGEASEQKSHQEKQFS